ncbi:MAG: alpha/beta hydrolase [Oscillospiraceae bacterium]|nr:alpha/beta hydrolase [Oscillospiraceae bacterium]
MSLRRAVQTASSGIAFAVVEYRPSEIAPFPAQVEDAKAAIRFLRANAEKYGLDPDRIGIWGDSSGGHTAAFVGITGDYELNDGPYPEQSSEVCCVIDWFGPSDLCELCRADSGTDNYSAETPVGFLIGRKDVREHPEDAAAASPIRYLSAGRAVPPILIMHGDADPFVPFHQSVILYRRLKESGKDARLIRLIGSGHGDGGFESPEATETVLRFFREKLP